MESNLPPLHVLVCFHKTPLFASLARFVKRNSFVNKPTAELSVKEY